MQFIDLAAQQMRIKDKLDARIQAVMAHGKYIMGPEVRELEVALASYCGAKHCISCANGTDALQLALMALSISSNDAVFVPSFTFASTIEVVLLLGATPVLVDVDRATFNLDPASLDRSIAYAKSKGLNPKVVIPVDLFGLPANYDQLNKIANCEGLTVIADSAQGFGGAIEGRRTGSLADITTTSFFPAKPLGCYGDGGAIFTDNEEWAKIIDSVRVHGKGKEKYDNIRVGVNSRLDTLQAAILLEKLAIYQDEIEARQQIANRYNSGLGNRFETPYVPDGYSSIWAQYPLKMTTQEREIAIRNTTNAGIPTMVYYPKALHQQTAYANQLQDPAGLSVSERMPSEVLCLPMHPYLSQSDQGMIIETIGGHID